MSNVSGSVIIDKTHLSLLERLAVWLTWAVGGALFLTVGWTAMEPSDPMGPVCVLTSASGVFMIVKAAVLGALCAAVCTLIAGRAVIDVGTFAAALGLAAVSLRGGTTEYLLLYGGGSGEGVMPVGVLAVRFAASSMGWFVVVMLAAVVSYIVMRLCFGSFVRSAQDQEGAACGLVACAADIPTVNLKEGRIRSPRTSLTDGVVHTAVVTGVGLMAFNILMTGAATRAIHHGQSCFVVAASVWLACYFAHRIAPVRSAFWSMVGVGLMALGGYVWASLTSDGTGFPPSIPQSAFMRILPIQFIGVGSATAISVLWSMHLATVEGGAVGEASPRRDAGR